MWDRLGQAALLNSAAQMNVVPTAIEAAAEVAEDPYAMSWLEPFEGPSRALGAAVSGVNPLAWGEGGINPEAPTLGEALVERGAPQWAGAASELLLVPDPVFAGKVADLFFLTSLIPGFRGFRAALEGANPSQARQALERHLPANTFGDIEDLGRFPELQTPEQLEAAAQEIARAAQEVRATAPPGTPNLDATLGRIESAAQRAWLQADAMRYREGRPVVPLRIDPENPDQVLSDLADIGLQGGVIPSDILARGAAVEVLDGELTRLLSGANAVTTPSDPRLQRVLLGLQALGDERSLLAMDLPLADAGDMEQFRNQLVPIALSIGNEADAIGLFARAYYQSKNMRGVSDEAIDGLSGNIAKMWSTLDEGARRNLGEMMLLSSMGRGGLMRGGIEGNLLASDAIGEGTELFRSRQLANEALNSPTPPPAWLDDFYARLERSHGFNREDFKALSPEQRDVYLNDLNVSPEARQTIIDDLGDPGDMAMGAQPENLADRPIHRS